MKTAEIKKSDYTAKKMKEMEGHDGYVIRFDLCYKGKKVADVYDDGNGGMIDIEWNKSYNEKTKQMTPYKEGAKEDFDALVEQMGEYEFMGSMSKYNDEIVVMGIYEETRLARDLNRKLKNKVLYINEVEGGCQEISWKGCSKVTADHIKAVYKHYPECKITLNEMVFEEALEAFIKACKP
tara:strand:+ start:260 stop:802 length:543 start_codon:yes stop_codon:yes gene_type:complete